MRTTPTLDMIARQRHEADTHSRNAPVALLLDRETYLLACEEMESAGTYMAQHMWFAQNRIMGLSVKVVPWMRGAVVLPADLG